MSRIRKSANRHVMGYVSLVGKPNVGKSTLLNAFIGQKLAIVADKPQTTRTVVQGVLTTPSAQIVFLDAPGVHKSDSSLNKRMMDQVRTALMDRDLLLYLFEATRTFNDQDAQVVDLIRKAETPTIAVVSKIDQLEDKRLLLPVLDQLKAQFDFTEYFPVSALTGEGVPELLAALPKHLPKGPALFPEDYLTDQPQRFLVAELIREKILHHTHDEVPHSVAVLIEKWEELPKLVRIFATIYVERDGQKAIIIGSQGQLLKLVGTEARHEIEEMVGRKVYLELFVKVRENWRESPQFLNEIDWRSMAGTEVENA